MTTIGPNSVTGSEVVEMDAAQPEDVLGARSSNTWEQNTGEHPVVVYAEVETDGTADAIATADVHVNTAESDEVVVSQSVQASTATTLSASVSFVVPPDHYYKVNAASGSLSGWREQELGAQ